MLDDLKARLADALDQHSPRVITQKGSRDAAVLIPIVAVPEPTLLFTKRTDTVRSHKGQISFPGGSIDPTDESALAAALREAEEEIALNPSAVEVLGELDTFPTVVSGFTVTPFVGWLDEEPSLVPDPDEVAEVLHVPLEDLTEEIRYDPGFEHAGRTYPTEAWVWREKVIWGVTARIVRQFLELLAESGIIEPLGGDREWWEKHLPPVT